MQFSEKQLGDLFFTEGTWEEHTPFHYKLNSTMSREYLLPSGKRCDFVGYTKNFRIFWVVEFKIVAEPGAILQAWQYRNEVFESTGTKKKRFRAGFVTIAAQFFKPETLFFAEKLGIECLHLNPVNFSSMRIDAILPLNKKKQHRESRYRGLHG